MDNANSNEYLEKITNQVIENLRRSNPVPSVQMQDVPRQPLGMTDEEEAALDDLDADENPNERLTQRRLDKSVARHDEYEDSDDEDMAEAEYGRHKPKRRGITEFRNQFYEEREEPDGPLPARKPGKEADKSADKEGDADEDVTMDDIQVEGDKSEAPAAVPAGEKADGDGDVDMDDNDAVAALNNLGGRPKVSTDPTIKKEDADALPADEPAKSIETKTDGERS